MRRIVIAILSALSPLAVIAQSQSFEFYYIAHDRTTPVSVLCDRLEEVFETADQFEDYAVIFYLPNYDDPYIVKVNLPGDNRKDFKHLISELRLKSAHEIYANVDYDNIINLVNEHDFIDENGQPTYSSVLFCWYVNPDFWQFLNNESLFASLYFTLEFSKYPGYVTTQIWHAAKDGLVVDKKYPFGTKNLCADMKFILYQY